MTANLETAGAHIGQAQVPALLQQVDFDRRLVCVLGLPFDAVNLDQAVQCIRSAAFGARRCFVSTPNLNFVMTAHVDAAFRGSVLRSDLSLADGMPLVWVARLLGLPLNERVSGADVFEALQAHTGPAVTVFLFGGPPGVAERAGEAINRRGGGLRCVGFDEAGFGSVESMSGDERIERINRTGAQFVIAALGAGKGQAWLEHNAGRLTAPVLAHLGAVLNFTAGSVRRAPRWMMGSGFEWLWRIKEEPLLWRRYWRDGSGALGLLLKHVIPDVIVTRRSRDSTATKTASASSDISRVPTGIALRLSGQWAGGKAIDALRTALTRCAAEADGLRVELSGATALDNAAVALLLVACGWFEGRGGFEIVGTSPALRASLRRSLSATTLLGAE